MFQSTIITVSINSNTREKRTIGFFFFDKEERKRHGDDSEKDAL
jgi:hypothetical protein